MTILKFDPQIRVRRKIREFTEKLHENPDIDEIYGGENCCVYYYKDGLQLVPCYVAGFTIQQDCFCLGLDGKVHHIKRAYLQAPPVEFFKLQNFVSEHDVMGSLFDEDEDDQINCEAALIYRENMDRESELTEYEDDE